MPQKIESPKGFASVLLILLVLAGAAVAGYLYLGKSLPQIFLLTPKALVTPIKQTLSTFMFLPAAGPTQESVEGRFCGGIAANLPENRCPEGYKCQLDGNYPDAGGKCVRN